MFETQENTQTTPENEFKADEATGRLSKAEPASDQDQLSNTEKSDGYETLQLPPQLEGCEENWHQFKQLAAELKIPAETVRKLVEWEAKITTDGRKISEEMRTQILDKWTTQSKEMFGPLYPQQIRRALDAVTRFGGEELRELLDVTGLGSHPVILKTFHQISKQISEDCSIGGTERNTTDKTFAEALYGKTL